MTTGGCTVASPDFLTGKPRDGESGLDDFGARYLSSQWGRWMSADWTAGASAVPYATLTNPQSLNLYAYVGNDPVDGRSCELPQEKPIFP
jgi:RHS repeat-associated protein